MFARIILQYQLYKFAGYFVLPRRSRFFPLSTLLVYTGYTMNKYIHDRSHDFIRKNRIGRTVALASNAMASRYIGSISGDKGTMGFPL